MCYPAFGLNPQLQCHGENKLRALEGAELPEAQVWAAKLACNTELLSYIPGAGYTVTVHNEQQKMIKYKIFGKELL